MSADRPTLLLLPGLLNDAELWHAQRAALAGIAECVVGDLTRADSMRALALQLLDRLPPRFALAGFSLGGYVAQEILRIAPERVERLALLDTSARADAPERVAQRRAQEASVRAGSTFHGFGERLMRHYVHPSRWQDEALLERVRGMTQRLGVEVFLRQNRLQRQDGRAVLRAYGGPVLVLWRGRCNHATGLARRNGGACATRAAGAFADVRASLAAGTAAGSVRCVTQLAAALDSNALNAVDQ